MIHVQQPTTQDTAVNETNDSNDDPDKADMKRKRLRLQMLQELQIETPNNGECEVRKISFSNYSS
jgi:hypothetical protein